MGAEAIEAHITLDRSMWGSDQAASLEHKALEQLVRDIRILENGGIGNGEKRITEYERSKIADLKRGLR
jgi:N-acetylneuraminate synthase